MQPENPPVPGLDELTARLLASLETHQLDGQLRLAALKSLRRALSSLEDPAEAAFAAGQALEHYAKAVLFADDPASLARPSKKESVAFLTGAGHPGMRHLGQVFTKPGPEAVTDAFVALGLPPPEAVDLRFAFDARNAAAHLAYGDPYRGMGAVGGALRLLEFLLQATGNELGDWLQDGELLAIFTLMTAVPQGDRSHGASLEARLRSRVYGARAAVASLRARVPHEVWLAMARQPRVLEWKNERVLRLCAAGDHLAWYAVEWEKSDTQDNEDPYHFRDETGYIGSMDCGLCGLELDGEQVRVLGLVEVVDYRTVER